MSRSLKAFMVSTALFAVAVVPAASVVTIASVDFAYAKNDKSSGGGNGNGNAGNRGNGNGNRNANAGGANRQNGNRGNGGQRGGPNSLSAFFERLTGQEKQQSRDAAYVVSAPTTSVSPPSKPNRPAKFADRPHPSELGNMNGALNANINAVLAHIRNGNHNGTIGRFAGLAVADASFESANQILLENALLVALEDIEEFDDLQAYYDALAADDTLERIPAIDDAVAALGFDPSLSEVPTIGDWTEEDLLDAQENELALNAEVLAAEDNILANWNKNADTDSMVLTPEEVELLALLRDRLEGQEDAINEAIEASFEDDDVPLPGSDDPDGDLVDCDIEGACDDGDDFEVSSN